MSNQVTGKPKGSLNIGLWVAQGLLAVFYGGVGFMKVSQPIDTLAGMMGWPGVMPEWLVRFVGTAELAGAIGLILPMLTGIMPRLTSLAAGGLMLLQVCAMIYHLTHGEAQVLPLNLALFAIPAFIVWGRWLKKI
jgi:putative oxidoreductase